METEIAIRARVGGRVTGVGFRYGTALEVARHPGVGGYVRNVSRDEVECLLQGPAPAVHQLLEWLSHGPASARVVRLDQVAVTPQPEWQEFRILD